MPPSAPLATHLRESIFDLVKGARVCRAQLLLEGVLDNVRDGCPPQLLGVREPHVDDCQVAAEPWPVLLELVEDGVVGQHNSERRQALMQVIEVIDEGAHLVIANSFPTRLSGPPRSAGRKGRESGRRCLNDKGPVDRREHATQHGLSAASRGRGEQDISGPPRGTASQIESRVAASYRDEHAVVQRQQDDGSVLVIAYRYRGKTERLTVPRAAMIGGR